MSLGRRFVHSSAWAAGANAVGTALLVLRSILLARMLPVEVFGIYAFAAALTSLTAIVPRFGMGDALLHRSAETSDPDRAAGVHLALTLGSTALWAAALLAYSFASYEGPLLLAMVALVGHQVLLLLATTPTALLRRRVEHRLLGALRVATALLSTVVGLGLAWLDQGLWALLAIDLVGSLLAVLLLYGRGPGWRPRLRWDAATVRYYLRFGGRVMLSQLLEDVLQKVDKLWTGAALGTQSLGYYSRASVYSRAPLHLLGRPAQAVVIGVFAELASDRARLAPAVRRINQLLAYGSTLLAVVLGVVAPQLIVVLIGEKWLPMLDAFRVLLAAGVPATLSRCLGELLVAVGQPAARIRIALLQLPVLGVGLLTLGPWLGITGVALSVLAATGLGLALSLHRASRIVDIGVGSLLWPPLLAAGAAVAAGMAVVPAGPTGVAGAWRVLGAAGLMTAVVYAGVLVMLRGGALREDLQFVRRHLGARG